MQIKIRTKDMHGEDEIKRYSCVKELKAKALVLNYRSEESENRILLFKNKVILERKGTLSGTVVFQENRNTDFYYKTPYFYKKLRCFTKKLSIKGDGFAAEYELYEGEELINAININVSLGDGN